MPGVNLTVTDPATGFKATGTSKADGAFTITLLPPGTYVLTASHQGFAPVEMRDVVLQTGDHVALDVKLRVGDVKESVTVSADAGQLQLKSESGERSEVITSTQIRDLGLDGRNILDLMTTLPGVVNNPSDPTSATAWGDLSVNGTRGTMKQMTIDGTSNVTVGANIYQQVTINPDAVAEMRILTSNFQAEYGKAGGAFVQFTTRGGTNRFHGGARYFRRHDSLNANPFFNNVQGLPRPLYRYNYEGYDIGGPVIIPGTHFNQDRNKLFFFWNQEFYQQLVPGTTHSIYVPTAAERNGDFSASTDGNGNRVTVRDTGAGNTPFPGNVIPKSRFYQYGPNILSFMPLPNTDLGGTRFNYTSQASSTSPRREDIARIDYNLNDKTRLTGRVVHNWSSAENAYGGSFNLAWNYPLGMVGQTSIPTNISLDLVRIFSPTVTNELIIGYADTGNTSNPIDPRLLRSTYGINFPEYYPNSAGSAFLPDFQFSGRANQTAATTTIYALPRRSLNRVTDITDNLMKVSGAHMFKFGVYIQRSLYISSPPDNTNGVINFGLDSNNPLNSANPYANALLGVYSSYTQANVDLEGRFRYSNVEPYLQDTWKVTRRLTLNPGLRISWIQPQYDSKLQANYFVPSDYDPSKAVRLYTRVLVGSTVRVVDPGNMPPVLTLQNTLSAGYLGLIVPGSGDPYNGIVRSKNGYYPGGFPGRGAQWGPRFGFAYDLTGSGRMVLRGGYGISYDRVQTNVTTTQINTPPTLQSPELLYGYLSDISNASSYQAPTALITYAPDGKVPNIQSFSIGIQRNIGWGTIVDVAYVGTLGRHLVQQTNINGLPYGTMFQRWAQDPSQYTNSVVPNVEPSLPAIYSKAGFNYAGDRALAQNFIRPYPGYADISFRNLTGSSNYNALQVSVRRALSRGLIFGVAYTWSKALATANADFTPPAGVNPYDTRAYDYKLASYDRQHLATINYVYSLPKVARFLDGNRVAKTVLDNWQISGITQCSTGVPLELAMTISGVNAGQRILGTPSILPMFYRYGGAPMATGNLHINPNAFYVPNIGDIGPYPRTPLRQPGFMNNDASVFKNIPLGKERARYLQLRLEMYNALNHPEFSAINSATQIATPTGGLGSAVLTAYPNVVVTNNLRPATGSTTPLGQYFGEYSAARNPRIVQLGAKVYF